MSSKKPASTGRPVERPTFPTLPPSISGLAEIGVEGPSESDEEDTASALKPDAPRLSQVVPVSEAALPTPVRRSAPEPAGPKQALVSRKVRSLVNATLVYGNLKIVLKQNATQDFPAEVSRWLIKTGRAI